MKLKVKIKSKDCTVSTDGADLCSMALQPGSVLGVWNLP